MWTSNCSISILLSSLLTVSLGIVFILALVFSTTRRKLVCYTTDNETKSFETCSAHRGLCTFCSVDWSFNFHVWVVSQIKLLIVFWHFRADMLDLDSSLHAKLISTVGCFRVKWERMFITPLTRLFSFAQYLQLNSSFDLGLVVRAFWHFVNVYSGVSEVTSSGTNTTAPHNCSAIPCCP